MLEHEFDCTNCDKGFISEYVSMNTKPPYWIRYTCKNCGQTKYTINMQSVDEYNQEPFQSIHKRFREFEENRHRLKMSNSEDLE